MVKYFRFLTELPILMLHMLGFVSFKIQLVKPEFLSVSMETFGQGLSNAKRKWRSSNLTQFSKSDRYKA